ncbi:hypothetical protein JCM11491_005781 [Sporobolomyces phaffii]
MPHAPPGTKRETIDLTLESSTGPEAGRGRSSSNRRNQPVPDLVIDDDDDDDDDDMLRQEAHEDADAAFARMLQAQEDEAYERELELNAIQPVPSTSSRGQASSSKPKDGTPHRAPTHDQTRLAQDDPKVIVRQHHELFSAKKKCPCGSDTDPPKTTKLSRESTLADFLGTAYAKCRKCKKTICKGCGEAKVVDGNCCAAGRAVMLYEVLSELDRVYLVDHLKKPSTLANSGPPSKKKRGKPDGKGAGTGYGSALRGVSATGVGGTPAPGLPVGPTKLEDPREVARDELYLSALTVVSSLLPRPNSPTAAIYDYLPHPTFAPLVELSTLPDLLASLLRNDSVPEWHKRSPVYFAMLGVLEGLGQSEATFGLLFGERRDKKWSEGLGSWLRNEGDIVWETRLIASSPAKPSTSKGKKRKVGEEPVEQGRVEFAVPLFSLLKKLAIQAGAFREAALSGDFDDDDAALIGICGDLASAGERCAALAQIWSDRQNRNGASPEGEEKLKFDGKGKGRATGETWDQGAYAKVCARLAYKCINLADQGSQDGRTFRTHHYHKDIAASASSRRSHASWIHFVKELAVLSTSLPAGIFMRVDEDRIDVIKVLIAGPEGTPYEGGLFEFDVFIPLQYPQVCPQVWLMTTGGQRVRFNPNLYNTGKVCLSLLGTWAGSPEEMWQPNVSTILQVLLSISSMILNSFPFYNEPGCGAAKDDKRNKQYNMNVSLATVRYAMLDWMDPSKKHSIWADVIYSHFTLLRKEITASVQSWATKDGRLGNWYPGYDAYAGQAQVNLLGLTTPGGGGSHGGCRRDLVAELKTALDRLEEWHEPAWLNELTKS